MKYEPPMLSPSWPLRLVTALFGPRPTTARSRVVRLEPGEVLRLEKGAGLEIQQGIAWLTATPADGDKLLPAGDRYEPDGNRPIVIQALGQTRLVLVLR